MVLRIGSRAPSTRLRVARTARCGPDGPPGHDRQLVYGMLEPSTICLANHTNAVVALLQEDAGSRNVVCMPSMEVEARRDVVARLPATEATDDIPHSLPALRDWEAGGFALGRGPVRPPPYLHSIEGDEHKEAPVGKEVLLKGAGRRKGRTADRRRSWEVTT
jgi:hypothetical protein